MTSQITRAGLIRKYLAFSFNQTESTMNNFFKFHGKSGKDSKIEGAAQAVTVASRNATPEDQDLARGDSDSSFVIPESPVPRRPRKWISRGKKEGTAPTHTKRN